MVFVLPVPLDFVLSIVNPAAYEEAGGASALDLRFSLTGGDSGWCAHFAGDLGRDGGLFGGAVDNGGDGMCGCHVFTCYGYASILLNYGVDSAGCGCFVFGWSVGIAVFAWSARARA